MIIDTNAIWSFIKDTLLPLLSLLAFVYMLKMNRRFAPTLRIAERLIKQWGSLMVERREGKKEAQRLSEVQLSSRSKIAKAIKAKVPFNLLANHTDEEIIGLLGDKDLMKGAMFLGKTGEFVVNKVVQAFAPSKEDKERHGFDKIPEIS